MSDLIEDTVAIADGRHSAGGRRWIPFDLIISTGLTAAAMTAALAEGPPAVRIPLGILLVLFLPGYGIVSALFPSNDGPDGVARFALSVALALAAIPFVALALDQSPWTIDRVSIALGLTIVSVMSAIVAGLLRARLPAPERHAPRLPQIEIPPLTRWSRQDQLIAGGLALSVLLLGFGAFDVVKTRITGERTTEMALFNMEGDAQFYPRNIVPGEAASVQIAVTNREGRRMTYRIVVGGSGQPVGQIPEVEIESGATWQGPVSFTLANTGDSQPVHFDLFRADKSGADPYRRLTLIVNGTSSNDPAE